MYIIKRCTFGKHPILAYLTSMTLFPTFMQSLKLERLVNIHNWRLDKSQYKIMTKKIGVVANCNRGYHAASGTWIKNIAGDDALYPNAIERISWFRTIISRSENCSF